MVCFWCVWHCFKSVKSCLFFSQNFGAFLGWLIVVHLGLVFCVAFVSVLFVLLLVLWLDVVVLFFLFGVFCFFLFFGRV